MLTLGDEQLDRVCARIPHPPRSPLDGRPVVDKRKVVSGMFWLLDNGAKWKDLPREEYGAPLVQDVGRRGRVREDPGECRTRRRETRRVPLVRVLHRRNVQQGDWR